MVAVDFKRWWADENWVLESEWVKGSNCWDVTETVERDRKRAKHAKRSLEEAIDINMVTLFS